MGSAEISGKLSSDQEVGDFGTRYAESACRGLIAPCSRHYKKIAGRAALIIPGTHPAIPEKAE
jgi:hypothetical protein